MEQQDFILVNWSKGVRKLFKASCSTCGVDRGYKRPDRLIGNCKSCQGKIKAGTLGQTKQCVACNTTKVNNPSKDWFAGPTCSKCYGKTYRQNNKAKIRKSINNWREVNKEKHQASEKQWRKDNKERKDATDTAWREANKEHVRKLARENQRRRELIDPSFRIARRLRSRFNKFIKQNDAESFEVLSKYIDYTWDDLRKHIEAQFEPWMNWDNNTVNGWHIDHIKPLCSFDLTNKNEIIEAWKLSNLRPLKCTDNWHKSKQDKQCKMQK